MKVRVLAVCAVLASPALVGCGPAGGALDSYSEAKLETDADASRWAVRSSAPQVYTSSTALLSILGLNGTGEAKSTTCPKQTQDGNTLRVEGGCTDEEGRKWVGSARRESEAAGSSTGKFIYDDFGYEGTTDCGGNQVAQKLVFKGTVNVTGTQEKTLFDVNVLVEGEGPDDETCTVEKGSSAWEYQGTIQNPGTSKQVWNGSGRVGDSDKGVVSAETKDEVIDSNACGNEASSGTTTMKSGANTVLITYDGASDCETTSTVQWSLNGTAKGELVGVSCAAPGGPLAGWIIAGLSAVALLRRRQI